MVTSIEGVKNVAPTLTAAMPALLITVIMIAAVLIMAMMIVRATIATLVIVTPVELCRHRRFSNRRLAQRLQQLLQFSSVEPHASALRAHVDLDIGAFNLSHSHIAVWANEQWHVFSPKTFAAHVVGVVRSRKVLHRA